MLQRPPEKCQKSNREIWNSSQEIHPETCNEENNGVRNGEKSVEIFYCCRRVNIALEFCKNSRFATNLSLGSISCSSIQTTPYTAVVVQMSFKNSQFIRQHRAVGLCQVGCRHKTGRSLMSLLTQLLTQRCHICPVFGRFRRIKIKPFGHKLSKWIE